MAPSRAETHPQASTMPLLRRAATADAADVTAVLIASRRAFLPYAPLAHSEAEIREWVADALIPGGVTIACLGARVAGLIATAERDATAWIEQLYVRPEHVGHGLGSTLLAHALADLRRPVRLYTFAANARARAFYERHGFRAIAFGDGSGNEEGCPDVLYELR